MANKTKPAPTVVPDEEIGPEILAKEIVKVSEAAQQRLNTRLDERALLLLLHDACGKKVGIKQIKLVLDSAAELKRLYVK